MDSHTLEGLTLRLEAAERGLRGARRAMWFGSILVAAAIGGGAWWLAGHLPAGGTQETVEAQNFIVRDAKGNARAALGLSEHGLAQIVLFQDFLPGDTWRQHSEGPFAFGVRASNPPQLVLWNRDKAGLVVTSTDLTLGGREFPRIALTANGKEWELLLSDSTGHMQALTASMVGAMTKGPETVHQAPKHRRKR